MVVTRDAMLGYHQSPRELVRALFVLPEHRVVYVRVPKVASSTLKLWLHRIHTGDHSAEVQRIHSEHAIPMPHQVGWDKVCELLNGDGYVFTFVRNPIARFESAYRNKIGGANRERAAWLRSTLGLPEDADVTPEHFVAALEGSDPAEWDPHWRPQHMLTMSDLIEYDAVGKLESFDTHLARIAAAASLPEVPVAAMHHREKRIPLLADEPALRRRVEALYARDFEAFGYDA